MDWARILAYVTGMVDQELLARNEYLAAENRILKAQLKGRLKLSDRERWVIVHRDLIIALAPRGTWRTRLFFPQCQITQLCSPPSRSASSAYP